MQLPRFTKLDRFLTSFATIAQQGDFLPSCDGTPTLKEWGFNAAIAKPLDQWGYEHGLATRLEPSDGQLEASYAWNPAFLKAAAATHIAMFRAEGRSDVPEKLLEAADLPWPLHADGRPMDIADIVPLDAPGWVRQRIRLFDEYRSSPYTYRIRWDDENAWWIYEPNQSGIKDSLADTLHRYGASRLQAVVPDLLREWDCEITQEAHLVYTVSFFNAMGGRLTLHGVTVTANRTGVVGIAGMTVKA